MVQDRASTAGVLQQNQEVWGTIFREVDPHPILARVRDAQRVIADDLSWSTAAECTWGDGFLARLPGARILEIGGGSGETACMMLALGAAHVTTTEITDDAKGLMKHLGTELGYADRLDVRIGDFLEMDLGAPHSYDIVMLREVLHHIPTEIEDEFVGRTAHFLRPDGMARFKDPAVNSRVLDELRWAVPTPGRPSKLLSRAKFKAWRAADPHPIRDDSTKHYLEIMRRHYGRVDAHVLGSIARFHRLVDSEKYHEAAYRRLSLMDARVPQRVQLILGNTQRLSCYQPIST